jgi:hypothetical protein
MRYDAIIDDPHVIIVFNNHYATAVCTHKACGSIIIKSFDEEAQFSVIASAIAGHFNNKEHYDV